MNAPTLTSTPAGVAPAAVTVGTDARGRAVESLRRVRVGVSLVLTLGVAASITANVLHAQPTAVGRAIAAWPPLALLLTVELISRVPVHSHRLAVLRLTATAAIAGIAAWVSYWHMVEVAHTHGETPDSAHLIPLSVDGLVVVASICLVEIGARLRALAAAAAESTQPAGAPQVVHGLGQQDNADEACEHGGAPKLLTGDRHGGQHSPQSGHEEHDAEHRGQAHPRALAGRTDTARDVARLQRRHPDWSATQIAARLNVHASTVRRHLNALAAPSGPSSDRARPGKRADASSDASTGTSTSTSTDARMGVSGGPSTTSTDTSATGTTRTGTSPRVTTASDDVAA